MTIAPSAAVGKDARTGRRNSNASDDGGDRDEGVQLAAAADGVADHRPAAAAADREALGHAGRQVDRAESEELLVGVDPVAVAAGERPRGQDVVDVADDHDAQRGPEQVARGRLRPHVRGADGGQPSGDRADEVQTLLAEGEHGGDAAATRMPISGAGARGKR